MKVEKYVTKEIEVDVREITLLSMEEYEAARAHIQPIDNWWWLRSPGYNRTAVRIVHEYYGTGNVIGIYCYANEVSVRPALRINPIPENLQIGDMFSFGGYDWMVIAETLALCNTEFCRRAFRKNRGAENANVYESSDIKPYLDNWLNTEIQREKDSKLH